MPMGNTAKTSLFQLLANNTDWTNIGDAGGLRGSATAGNYYVGGHTASPGTAGSQTTSELAYGGYARVAVTRSGAGGWTVSGTAPTQFANTAAVSFPISTASGVPTTFLWFSLGRDTSGAGLLIWFGQVTSPAAGLVINDGVQPSFPIGNLTFTIA